jgi:hypothetical protein
VTLLAGFPNISDRRDQPNGLACTLPNAIVVFDNFSKGNREHEQSSFIPAGSGLAGRRCHVRFAIGLRQRK